MCTPKSSLALLFALGVVSVGCGSDGVRCVRAIECVETCGGPVVATLGCDSSEGCPAGSFDSLECTADTGAGDTGVGDTGAGDTSTGDTSVSGDAGPVTCGASTCGAGEYCVQPCCGGAPPMCVPRDDSGACPAGTSESDMCDPSFGECMPGPCTPPPAFCEPDTACTGGECPAPDSCGGGYYDSAMRTYFCQCA